MTQLDSVFLSRKIIEDALNTLSDDASSGPDSLPSCFLKKFAAQLSNPLFHIFSESMNCGKLPQSWKIGKIIPIYKGKGRKCEPANYRPISLTSICCKVYERIIRRTIVNHLKCNDLISHAQHGFLSGKSTQTQLLECINDWTKSIDSKKSVDVFYLDIAKAFDTVSHPKLLKKLESYGISGDLLRWIEDFLSFRTQYVSVKNCDSSRKKVDSGVPQGSVLGPVLFLIYINDLAKVVKNCSLKMFADDTKIYFKCDQATDRTLLEIDLELVFEWAKMNQLSIAMQKCFVLHLGPANSKNQYVIDNVPLASEKFVKDLGVYVSESAHFNLHISKICSKSYYMINLIFRSFICRDPKFLISMFNIYVRSILEFNSCVWSPCDIGLINQLEKVQKRFTKRIPALTNLSYSDRLKRLNQATLETRRLQADLIQTYKIISGHDNLNFNDFFSFRPHNYSCRGNTQTLFPVHRRTNLRSHSFSLRVTAVWNTLPSDVVRSPSLSRFKNSLKNRDFSNFLKFRFD